jgi:hypothetical protein
MIELVGAKTCSTFPCLLPVYKHLLAVLDISRSDSNSLIPKVPQIPFESLHPILKV